MRQVKTGRSVYLLGTCVWKGDIILDTSTSVVSKIIDVTAVRKFCGASENSSVNISEYSSVNTCENSCVIKNENSRTNMSENSSEKIECKY
jgi:hypothetical protein